MDNMWVGQIQLDESVAAGPIDPLKHKPVRITV
jgi:hypothetical protein